MQVNEIFKSIQGESSFAGVPCIFVRLNRCNLRCQFCDSKYSYDRGKEWLKEAILDKIKELYCDGDIIEITGGEPLLQYRELNRLILMIRKWKNDIKILIETNGSIDVGLVTKHKNTHIIMDWKCPTSGMADRMLVWNLQKLEKKDELKFVLGDIGDYYYMYTTLSQCPFPVKAQVLISTIWGLDRKEIVEKMLKDKIKARFQIQLHKLIWDINKRGV